MKDPKTINLMSSDEVMRLGWVAEARDKDGHLISTQAFSDDLTINANFEALGQFIADYETNGETVQLFPGLIASKIA